jgi:CBS domain-containing protein
MDKPAIFFSFFIKILCHLHCIALKTDTTNIRKSVSKVMSSIDSLAVSNFMTRNVKTVIHVQSLKESAKLMYENDIGCVVVVMSSSPHKPAGIVTERDILRVVAYDQLYQPTTPHEIAFLDMTVMSFMTTPVITISAETVLWDALQVMQLNKIRRLPVLDKNQKMVGIITEKDIMRAIANNRSLVCELQERLPAAGNDYLAERIREITFLEELFPSRKSSG